MSQLDTNKGDNKDTWLAQRCILAVLLIHWISTMDSDHSNLTNLPVLTLWKFTYLNPHVYDIYSPPGHLALVFSFSQAPTLRQTTVTAAPSTSPSACGAPAGAPAVRRPSVTLSTGTSRTTPVSVSVLGLCCQLHHATDTQKRKLLKCFFRLK